MSMTDLKMLTQDDICDLLKISRDQVTMLREVGIINAIKTGRNYMFSQQEIRIFQEKYKGYDISNRVKAIQAYTAVETHKKEIWIKEHYEERL